MRRSIVFSLIIAAMLSAVNLSAQSAVLAQSGSAAENVGTGMSALVTLNLNSVTLANALHEIARQANLKVGFGPEVYDVRKTVTIRVEKTPVAQAILKVLQGTGIGYTISPTGQLAFMKASERAGRGQGIIIGRIIDSKTGKNISGANVSIGNDTRGVITAEDGLYKLTGIVAGTHVVNVRLVGYAKQTRSITVGDGATVTVDFKLEPSASVLDQVVVTGTVVSTELKAVPNAITVITAKQLEERGITRIDQLFRGDVPGLYAMNKGSGSNLDVVSMYSRGATSLSNKSSGVDPNNGNTNPIKTYIDGIEMANPLYLNQIDPKSIERIEILTGPQASTIYGSGAINGVMQIFTKRGSGSRPKFTFDFTSGITQNISNSHLAPSYVSGVGMSGTEGRVSYNIGGTWNQIGAWVPSKNTQRLNVNAGGRADGGKITVDVSLGQGWSVNKSKGNYQQAFTELRAAGIYSYSPDIGVPIPSTANLRGSTLGFSLGFRPYSWWSHGVVLGTSNATNGNINDGFAFKTRSDTSLNFEYSFTSRTSQSYNTTIQLPMTSIIRLNLTMGGDHWRTNGYSGSIFSNLRLVGNFGDQSGSRIHPDKNSGAYIQGQFAMWDALFFTYGIRADWNPNFGEKAKVRPGRYGVSYARDFGSISAKLRGSYGRSIRPPTAGLVLGQLEKDPSFITWYGRHYPTLPNPDLGPEFQQGGEGGIELYMGNRGSLIVTRYNQTVDDLILNVFKVDSVYSLISLIGIFTCPSGGTSDYDSDGHCYRYQFQNLNVASIRNQGWELQGSFNTGPLTTRGTYSWTKSRVIGVTEKYKGLLQLSNTSIQAGGTFTFLAEHTWALGFSYAHAASTVSLSINGIGMRYTESDELNNSVQGLVRLQNYKPRMDLTNYRPIGRGYAMADLNASHRISPRLDATLQVTNLTNYYQNDVNGSLGTVGRVSRIGFRFRTR